MKHLNLKHFKQLLLSLMALACVTTTYAQGNSYDDLCKPTHSTSGNKRCQIKGEILEQTNLADNSPLVFEPTGSNASQNWANIDNEIKAYPGATFKLKVTYSDAWGSLTVFQLRSNNTPSSEDKIFGTYEGSWYSGVPGTNELYTNIAKDTESGIKASQEDKTVTCPITIPSDIRNGELVVIRFIVCKTADGATYDGTPCVSNATELNYCDYIVRIVEKEQEGLEVTWEQPENGNITVKNGTEVLESPATVEPGTKLTIVPAPASGRYELGTLTANDTPITPNKGKYEVTINENTNIAATFSIAKYEINWTEPTNGTIKVVYADNETQEVTKGSKVELDTKLKVIAEPSTSDYVLSRVWYVYGYGTEYDITKEGDSYVFTVQETNNGIKTIYINAEFEKVVKYRITWAGEETMQGNSLKVVYADTDEEVLNSETLVPEGSELEIIPTEVAGYHLSALSYTISGLQNVPFTIGEEPYTFIVEGGESTVRGYFVNISATFTPDTYTLSTSVNPAEGGSVSVTTTDGATIEGSVTHGQTIVITASENDGYKLQSLDVKGATKVADQENQYTVEDDVTVTATFVEDAPVETWSEITLITMSSNKSGNADVSAVTFNGKWTIVQNGASNECGSNISSVFGPYVALANAGDYLAVKYDVPAKAKYKFSFLSKRKEGLTEGMKLCYGKSLDALTDASDVMDIPTAVGDKPGIETESQTIDLEAGEYYFVYYITKATDKVRVADFRLYQLDGSAVEPTPEHTVTLNKPENGNLSVTYNNGTDNVTVSTDKATEAQTFEVAEGTKLTVTVTPADGYQLETLSPEMTEVEDSENVYEYTVAAANVNIEATFKPIQIQYGQVSVAAPDEAQGSIKIQRYNPDEDLWVNAEESFLEQVEFGTKLRAKVEAKTGYTLKSVMKGETAINKDEDGYYYFTVNAEEITISAEFEQEAQDGYLITITNPAEGGTIKVMNGETEVTNKSRVPENTTVTIIPEAAPGYTTQKVLANGKIVAPRLVDEKPVYEKSITEDTEFTVVFKVMEYEINWVDPKNGTLKLYNSNNPGQELVKGTKVPAGTKITVVPDANDNYIFTRTYYTLGGKEVEITEGEKGFEFTVTPDSENPNNTVFYVYAEFEPKTYTLTTEVTPAEGGSVSVTVDGKPAGETVKYGDVITVTVTENPRYKHESTVVEGAEEIDGQAGEYTVKGAVTITVTFTEDTSSINSIENGTVYYNAAEEVLYTGNAVSVRVYDLSGRLVLNAENQATVSLAELADGVYTAIVGNVVLKLKK